MANPFAPGVEQIQGAGPVGSEGYPIAVVNPPGGVINVNITGNNTDNNFESILFTLAARSGAGSPYHSVTIFNQFYRGGYLFFNLTSVAGATGNIGIQVEARNPVDGTTFGVLGFNNTGITTFTATGFYLFSMYPGTIAAVQTNPNSVVGTNIKGDLGGPLPFAFRYTVIYSNPADSFTWSLAHCLIR